MGVNIILKIPLRFSMSAISSFKSMKKKHGVYRAKKKHGKVFLILKRARNRDNFFFFKKKKLLTKEQQESYENEKIYYICKKKIEN